MEAIKAMLESLFLLLADLGYWGIMLGLMVEVIPSEIVLAYGGFLISEGHITFLGAVVFGTIGGTLAQLFLYWIGKHGGRPFLPKYGKYLLIHEKHLKLSEQWFARYGGGVVFTARFIPVVRHAISIPAGISGMSLLKFTTLTTLAVIPWSVFFIFIGMQLGQNWREFDDLAAPYIKPAIWIALSSMVIYFIWQWRRKKSNPTSIEETTRMKEVVEAEESISETAYSVPTLPFICKQPRQFEFNGRSHTIAAFAVLEGGIVLLEPVNADQQTNALYRKEYAVQKWLYALGFDVFVKGVPHEEPSRVTRQQLQKYRSRTKAPLSKEQQEHVLQLFMEHTSHVS